MNRLAEIVAQRRRDIASEKRRPAPAEAGLPAAPQRPHDLSATLRARQPCVIAEIKRRSPSAGDLALNCDVAQLALSYERGGAAAISVLTEPHYFGGGWSDLAIVRTATSLPILCKDFIVDRYQIERAAAAGADAVLLIVAVLTAAELRDFVAACAALDMSALVEVHDEFELAIALGAGAAIIGVNNRDLQTFSVDRSTAERLCRLIPPSVTVVAESGYGDRKALARAYAAGAHAVLMGECLLRAADPALLLQSLQAAAL